MGTLVAIVKNNLRYIMIVHKILENIFTSQAIIVILRELNKRKIGITGRELARQTNLTHKTVIRSLDNLEKFKLINRTISGRAYNYTLNRQNYIYQKLLCLMFEAETNMITDIKIEIKKNLSKLTRSTILFGSAARKEETLNSDFDLCIVYDNNKDSIEKIVSVLRDKLDTKYGISLAPFYISTKEFINRAKRNKPPVAQIQTDGIVISGKSLKAIING